MKKIIFASALISAFLTNVAYGAENYKLDPHHTSVTWSASHFGFSNPNGKFAEIEGDLLLDEKRPNKSHLNVVVNINNLVTGYINFDNHLKGEDFFNSTKFPVATFVSKKVVITGKNTAKVHGDLTIIGVTKPIVMNVKMNKIAISPISNKKTAGFSAIAVIKRSQFGINYAVPSVSDEVKLIIEAEATLVE